MTDTTQEHGPASSTTTTPGDLDPYDESVIFAIARYDNEQDRASAFLTFTRERKAAAVTAHAALVTRCATAENALDEVRESRARCQGELARFREQVREAAISVQEEQGWCVEGLNQVLSDLGLPRKTTEYEVTVEITARQIVTVKVEAEDEEGAQEKVRDGEVGLDPDRYDWEWQTADDLEFLSVEES